MGNFIDLSGQRFGRLMVLKRVENSNRGQSRFLCKCDCGNETIVHALNLKKGSTKSCGCYRQECGVKNNTIHGMTGTLVYKIWRLMIARCEDSKEVSYKNYGGRGITVCKQWRYSFETWYADMGEMPTPKHTLERINNDGNYEPSNCRWATWKEQCNNRRNNHIIEFNGQCKTIAQWSDIIGIPQGTLFARIHAGWTIEKSLTQELRRW